MGKTETKQNFIHKESNSRLNLGMFAVIQFNIFVFPYTSNAKIKISKAEMLSIVL
jgi:hypothetical protein